MLAEEFSALDRDAKQRLLVALRASMLTSPTAEETLHPRWLSSGEPHQSFPLTDLQAAYFTSKHMPEADPVGCHTYLEFQVIDLDVDRLERAWQRLLAIHPMLLARIDPDGTQCVPPEVPAFRIVRYEVASDSDELDRHLEALRGEMSHKVYRPGAWPLFDIRVTHTPGALSRVHVSMDSWIVDAASARLLYRQWRLLYDTPNATLSAPNALFRDFVLSMKAFEGSVAHQRCANYWAEKLRDLPAGPPLPYRSQHEASRSGAQWRRRLVRDVPSDAWHRLTEMARAEGLSLAVVLLGLFAEQLRLASGATRFALLLTLYNRPRLHPQIDQVVGPFTSTSIFVWEHRPGNSFVERLHGYQKQLWQDLDNGYVSGVAALRSKATSTHKRPISVVFTAAFGPDDGSASAPSWLDAVDYAVSQTPGIDLHFQASMHTDGLRIVWDVADGRLERNVVDALFEGVCRRLAALQTTGLTEAKDLLSKRALSERRRLDVVSAVQGGGNGAPLTPLQQAYLAHRLTNPTGPRGLVYREFTLASFDPGGFQIAVHTLIARSAISRSMLLVDQATFVEFANGSYLVPIDDLRSLDASRCAARLDQTRAEMENTQGDKANWPFFALRVSWLNDGSARLHILLDLLIFDGYSVWQFYDDLLRLYAKGESESMRQGITYADYARARERYRGTAAHTADRFYWSCKFRDLPSGPRWPWQSAEVSPIVWRRYAIEFDRWRVLKEYAAARSVPPIAVLLCAYSEVLRRWSRGERLTVVMVDYHDRDLVPELAHAYGDCSSLAWVPIDGSRAATFSEHLHRIVDVIAQDRLHDWGNPFEAQRTAGASDDPRGRFPAVLTDCLNVPVRFEAGITEVYACSSTPDVDIDQMVIETARGLSAYWQVRDDHVPPAMAAAMCDDYYALLEELATDDLAWQRAPAELGRHRTRRDWTGAPQWTDEQVRSLYEWNRTDVPFNREQCLHRLIEQQTARGPDRLALLSDEGTLTYGQLEHRANQLARYLQRQGVLGGSLVGVLLDRSLDTVVALLAILKAGAAYVPMNVTDPSVRIATILRRAGINTVISKRLYAVLLADGVQRVVLVDEQAESIAAEAATHPPAIDSCSDDVAYVIFTSGSTGEPKGVVVRHKPVINLIEWAKNSFGFTELDRVLFINPLGFDLSVFDVFAFLAYGGSIRIVSEQDRLDPTCLARLLLQERITFWNSAPAYLEFVMPGLRTLAGGMGVDTLRLVFLSGDWIPVSLPGAVRAVFPNAQVIGLGGATEATVWSNYYPIGEVDPAWTSIPYGRPIQNARYYILDERLQPCPSGTPGHLYIGGECLSSGYLNAPDLTNSRFLPDPFHERSDMTMYHTGDMARFADDGTIEFLGRVDNQVKIRGFRVELGEVEAGLARCGLASPVAVVRGDISQNRRIVGFGHFRSTKGRIVDQSFWQALRDVLPDYMVPADVYALTALPLTGNGKVDREQLARAPLDDLLGRGTRGLDPHAPELPEQDPGGPRRGAPSHAELTRFLCSTVATILAVDPADVQPDTDLGTLGFNSLHFALLSARLGESYGTPISVAKLFRCANTAEIADTLVENYPEAIVKGFGVEWQSPPAPLGQANSPHPQSLDYACAPVPMNPRQSSFGELAVVGIYSRMPGAEGINAFWDNLVKGRHCIEVIPRERWNWRAYYGDPAREENVTTVNRAGFIADVDKFDAAFFGISPREAELMDPRQRLLLEGVWKTLEDAGYSPATLRGEEIGVYIAANGDEYASLLQQAGHPVDQFSLTGNGRSFLSNRMSYFFGWHGPSEVVDTTCSSSLVALHNAARAIHNGDCSMAIVGGLNMMIDPFPHLSLAKVGVLSPDGACRTFDARANGYVRSEGVGLLLVKPLLQAEADHDHIYAVICGTAVNHGGKSNALTAPNPRAQARVIVDAFRRGAIDPRQVGYIEAHGTGTPLGDPVEIEGIKEAFSVLYQDRGETLPSEKRISVGSVKTGIGHLEAAAGIAGLIKVILMLCQRTRPPLVHFTTVNPEIDVERTPFFFQTQADAWVAPQDRDSRSLARVAGISAFGFGGVNAHVVVREHAPQLVDGEISPSFEPGPIVVPLSARSRTQLAVYAGQLRDTLRAGAGQLCLGDVAFTLRVGRAELDERVAIVTHSLDQLIEQLDAIGRGEPATAGIYYGNARTDGRRVAPEINAAPPEALAALTPANLAQSWAWGLKLDWRGLYGQRVPRRVSLATYPFERASHWPAALRTLQVPPRFPCLVESKSPAQPGYVLKLTGDESLIEDHLVNGVHVMPAAAYLECVAAVALRLFGAGPFGIKELVWLRALRFDDELPRRLLLTVTPGRSAQQLAFFGEEGGQRSEFCSATLEPTIAHDQPARIDIASLLLRCPERLSSEICYRRLDERGLSYGPSFRVVRTLWWAGTEAIAHVVLPQDLDVTAEQRIHPSLADGALQTALLHQILTDDRRELPLPFAARQITSYSGLPRECYVHATLIQSEIGPKALRKYKLTVLKTDGEVVLEVAECTGLPIVTAAGKAPNRETRLYREYWRTTTSTWPPSSVDPAHWCHISIGLASFADALARSGQRVLANVILPGEATPDDPPRSAVLWDRVFANVAHASLETIVLWYDVARLIALPVPEQLHYGFDTVFELTKLLIGMRQLRRCRVVLCLISSAELDIPTLEALSGFARAAQHESPKLEFKLVRFRGVDASALAAVSGSLLHAVQCILESPAECLEHRFDALSGSQEVRYLESVVDLSRQERLPITRGGVYLITGGLGGFGRQLARILLRQGARLALIGRSPAVGARATALKALGSDQDVQYYQADVADPVALSLAIGKVHASMGPVRGVFHCAGVVGEGLLLFKPLSTARAIVSAKVLGTACLDEATQVEPLDFFVLFSSLASVMGPVGICDYSYANRYASLYVAYRQMLVRNGLRSGKTLALSWPPWSDGGMQLPPREQDRLRSMGIESIDCAQAMGMLATYMTTAGGHYLCISGDAGKFEPLLFSMYPSPGGAGT